MDLSVLSLLPQINSWLEEDDLNRNFHYLRTLPRHPVQLDLKVKSPLILAGAEYFAAAFVALGMNGKDFTFLSKLEGKALGEGDVVSFPESMPFAVAVTGERLALNLLQHASSIATWTSKHVRQAQERGIKILDTRKTTPGLRTLEKYAVRVGGGYNHRLGQTDVWMIKDNHKSCLGGLEGALEFFRSQGALYNNVVAEIHDLGELREAIALGIKHVMLDNFKPEDIRRAVELKAPGMNYEVSGGLRLNTIGEYLIDGVDALSIGSLTYAAPRVDLSLKYKSL